MSTFTVTFPGGMAVDATFKGNSVRTDQPVAAGGGGTAMAPFDLFLASIATCMGFYALRFCQERSIPTADLGLTLEPRRNPETKRLDAVRIDLVLPEAFPEKYRSAIVRAIDHCAVKRVVLDPPAFEIETVTAAPAGA